MSIRPIDMQVSIPKTSELSNQQQGQMHRGELQQQQFVTQMEKNIIKNQQQVQNSNKSEYQVDKDANNKNKYQQNNNKKQKNKKRKKEELSKDTDSTIDIRI
ncbi:hypothetical protein [Defluviitalea phaphyphila]|uniref:hypothetical protein n=1 Tax=Defluviitalea phaphyphila TaxID=1473580 RepID=UPI0007318A18|nr:hypothetical protein [Defluviitalea phaphyphila]